MRLLIIHISDTDFSCTVRVFRGSKEVLADLKSSPELKFVADDNLRKGGQAEIGGRGFQRSRHGGLLVVADHPDHGDEEDGDHCLLGGWWSW